MVWFGSFYTAITTEDIEFQRAMINLTSVTGGKVKNVTDGFVRWVSCTTFPWRFALDYCLRRAIEGKSLPFTVEPE